MIKPTSIPTSSNLLDKVTPTTQEMEEEEESAAGGCKSLLPDAPLFSENLAIIGTLSNCRLQQRLRETGKRFLLY